jgi:hypothetical protein
MHEGASGAGKSEMLEQVHRENDGRLLLGENIITGEKRHLEIPRSCLLRPVNDDMALCHPSLKKDTGKLVIMDAEDAWFLRTNHIDHYGADVWKLISEVLVFELHHAHMRNLHMESLVCSIFSHLLWRGSGVLSLQGDLITPASLKHRA